MLEFSHKMLNESIFQVIAEQASSSSSASRSKKGEQGNGVLVKDTTNYSHTLDEKSKAR